MHKTAYAFNRFLEFIRMLCKTLFFFFFQAEDGIRDYKVTGVQTCALPILAGHHHHYERFAPQTPSGAADPATGIREIVAGTGGEDLEGFGTPVANSQVRKIGRASCRERV